MLAIGRAAGQHQVLRGDLLVSDSTPTFVRALVGGAAPMVNGLYTTWACTTRSSASPRLALVISISFPRDGILQRRIGQVVVQVHRFVGAVEHVHEVDNIGRTSLDKASRNAEAGLDYLAGRVRRGEVARRDLATLDRLGQIEHDVPWANAVAEASTKQPPPSCRHHAAETKSVHSPPPLCPSSDSRPQRPLERIVWPLAARSPGAGKTREGKFSHGDPDNRVDAGNRFPRSPCGKSVSLLATKRGG